VEGTGGIQIERGDDRRDFYINGRHRTAAMQDAGVRRTLIIRWEYLAVASRPSKSAKCCCQLDQLIGARSHER
jgi:hypothetical protein